MTPPDSHSTPPGGLPQQPARGVPTWVNVPNAISVVRLLVCVPLTVWLISLPDERIGATISLAVFGATDWIDGFLARRWGQTTRVGAVLDPVADRVGIIAIILAMMAFGILAPWMVWTIIATDLVVGVVGLLRFEGTKAAHVTWLGKTRTALIMAGLPLLLLGSARELAGTPVGDVATVMLSAGCLLHVAAGADYAWRIARYRDEAAAG